MSSIITRYLRRQNAGAAIFRKGAVVSVTSIADEKQFDVTIASSKPIARGSTADIYEGKMFEEGRVALKVVTNTASDDMAREQLIRREVRAAHQVRHPHILPLLGLAITEAHTIIVSPLMRNGNLVRYLKEHPAANRNILVLQVAEALNHLHAVHGLVHGDMKCENVLISDEGTALLTDFGLSTFVDKSKTFIGPPITTSVPPSVNLQDILSLTLPEVRLLYTPEFAGPELLFSGDAQATEQLPSKNMELDVYAFGMLMIQVFSGQPPCMAKIVVI